VRRSGQLVVSEEVANAGRTAVSERQDARSCVDQLARFFPQASPARLQVQVTAIRSGNAKLREAVTLEFAAVDCAIFASTLPLEFDDRVRLERDGKFRKADATVIAVQYHAGRKAVAVKFTQGPCDWVTQP
jgi:hypothetical protein